MSHTSQPPNEGERIRHYILICWCDDASSGGWRFALVNPRTEERRPFPDLAALMGFLEVQLTQFKGSADDSSY
jgi:hypothetical protein